MRRIAGNSLEALNIMQRKTAITLLCNQRLQQLSVSERESLLLDWWSLDESDDVFSLLPETLQVRIKSEKEPYDVNDSIYNSLLIVALENQYQGVRNAYIEKLLQESGVVDYRIVDSEEQLHPCPCCRYKTLSSRGEYDICPVCFWEDAGQIQPQQYSDPNRMTLAEARKNFENLGAISEEARKWVDPHGTEKWMRE